MLTKIDALMMRRPNLIEAMFELGLVPAGTPVLGDVSRPEDVAGMTLLGPVPPRFARFAKYVAEPIIRVAEHERGGTELSVQETIDRFQGLFWARVEDLGAPSEPADIITTRHESLIEYIRIAGLARPDAPVEPHAQVEHVSGKHAIGILPVRIGYAARCVTNVPTALPTSRQWTELSSVEEQIQYLAGDVFSYRVHAVPESGPLDG
jgi:hypothetical protein